MTTYNELRQQKEHVAILGFAEPCGLYNQSLAYGVGLSLAKRDYVVTAGNLTSTFYSAFKGAKAMEGNTLAVLEEQMELNDVVYCDVILSVNDTNQKYRVLAEFCSSAIIIGGGYSTKHIETEFLNLNKPVVALKGTGGITRSELDERTECVSSIKETLTFIH